MKNLWKRSIAIMLFAFMLTSSVGCNGDDKTSGTGNLRPSEEKNQYDLLDIGNIHIGMWVTPPAANRTQESFDTMAESGINFVNGFEYFESDENQIREALTFADNSGLKFLVADRRVTEAINTYDTTKNAQLIEEAMTAIESYYEYPAYAGQLLIDEPGRSKFETVHAFIDAFEINYPGKQWHVNMFPSYAEGGAGVPYLQYVDDWMELVNPNYYSYDSYPLLVPDPNNPFTRYEIEDYFYNLDVLRSKTAEKKIPLWSFIQTLGISGTPGVADKRTPSREDIRWQVYVNLAFGVKGLQYFCYWTPSGGSESFTDAMIAADGTKTERYDYVKEVNTEILNFGEHLLQCDSKGIILNVANPSDAKYKLYDDSLTSYGKVTAVSGDDAIIGCFYNPYTGEDSLLIVPTTPRDNAELSLTMQGVEEVTAYIGGQARALKTSNGVLTLSLNAGDGMYIIL